LIKKKSLFAIVIVMMLSIVPIGIVSPVDAHIYDRCYIVDMYGPYSRGHIASTSTYPYHDFTFAVLVGNMYCDPYDADALRCRVTFNWGDGTITTTDWGYAMHPASRRDGVFTASHHWTTSGTYQVTASVENTAGEVDYSNNPSKWDPDWDEFWGIHHTLYFTMNIQQNTNGVFNPPPPAPCHTVTVNLRDIYGNPINGKIIFDNQQFLETTTATVTSVISSAYVGDHYLYVSASDNDNYALQYFAFSDGSANSYSDPTGVHVVGDISVTAYFGPPSPPVITHSVTIHAVCHPLPGCYPPDPNTGFATMQIDGTDYQIGQTYSLTSEYHTFTTNGFAYIYWGYGFMYYTINGVNYYTNTITLPISFDVAIEVHYCVGLPY
jgi:hypothetical protein